MLFRWMNFWAPNEVWATTGFRSHITVWIMQRLKLLKIANEPKSFDGHFRYDYQSIRARCCLAVFGGIYKFRLVERRERDCPCYQVRVHLGTEKAENPLFYLTFFLPVLYCHRLCTSFSDFTFVLFLSFLSSDYRGHEELESARGCLREIK